MASNREERFLMRQRGAGTRQVQDISFNLALPGVSNEPLRPQRSGRSRRTPQLELAPQRSSRKTPRSTQRLQPRPSSRRTPGTSRKTPRPTEQESEQKSKQLSPIRTPGSSRNRLPERPSPYDIPSNEDREQLPSSQPSQRDEQGAITKRRNLGANLPLLPRPHPITSVAKANVPSREQDDTGKADALPKNLQGSGGKKRKKRKSIGQIPRKRTKPSLEQAVAGSGDQAATSESAPTAQAQSSVSNGIAEPQEASSTPQGQGLNTNPIRKKRKSIGVLPKIRRKSTVATQDVSPPVEPSGSIGKDTLESQVLPEDKTARGRGRPRKSLPTVEESQEKEVDHQGVDAELAKHKAQGRPRRSLPVVEGDPEHLESTIGLVKSKPGGRPRRSLPLVEEDEHEEAEHLETTTDSAKSRPRGRPRKSLPIVEEAQDEECERLETLKELGRSRPQGRLRKSGTPSEVINETQAARASQAPTKKSNNKPRRSRVSFDTSETSARKPRAHNESVPITVHRLSRLRALVFEDDDEDILAGPAPFPKKSGVNAIDVLGQVCREMIAKSMDTLQRGAQNEGHEGEKSEWKRKRKVVEMFGNELDARLFQMSEALDNNYALSTRLKQVNKEKIALREELLSLRREREKIALRTDEVRRSHAKASKAAQEDNDLNTMLHDIELAVQRGRAQQDNDSDDGDRGANGLDVLIHDVAATVSSANGPGLLDQVKRFNAYLERALLAINARS